MGPSPAFHGDSDPDIDSLERKFHAWQRADADWGGPSDVIRKRVIDELDKFVLEYPRSRATWTVLVEGAAFGDGGPVGTEVTNLLAIGRRARFHLVERLRSPDGRALEAWLLAEVVVALPAERDARRPVFPTTIDRRTALVVLEGHGSRGLRVPLLAVARRGDDPLRANALRTLARWTSRFGPDEAIDLYLVELLGRPMDRGAEPHPYTVLLERIDSTTSPLGPKARARLRERASVMLLDNDWRNAARAVRLSEGFPIEERVPLLLDALTVWDTRAGSSREIPGLVRVRGDIVAALQRLSDQRHGPYPKQWIDWWVRVRTGEAPMPGSEEFEAARKRRELEPRSTAGSFFGLRPDTDRVTFVIDVSGSMQSTFGTTENTRYEEAVEQMMRFLQGSPKGTRFNVVLFSGEVVVSSDALVPVDADTMTQARRSLLKKRPGGGTFLRPAIEAALCSDPATGLPDPTRLEADTIVVLCDGATSEGSRWVAGFLDRILPAHPVKFHGVLIGSRGDGTLEELARRSGGDYLRVGG